MLSRAASSSMLATGHMCLFKFGCKLIKIKTQFLSLTGQLLQHRYRTFQSLQKVPLDSAVLENKNVNVKIQLDMGRFELFNLKERP